MEEALLAEQFIDLNLKSVVYLLLLGFIGGLLSGFIGSGGAFVLTPGMMSIGVPGVVAVASNMAHKFPKSLKGATWRAKFGQVDLKLGLVLGASAEAGVLVGAHVQESINHAFGAAGSNLYVSVAFVLILSIVGGYVLRDALRSRRYGSESVGDQTEEAGRVARWVQSIRIPGTMVYFRSLGTSVSVLLTIPMGFATGMLAATIAVGGFIGVPAMIYLLGAPSIMASATELVVAFVMGMGGTIKYASSGLVDIRLALILLAGSLFGVALGAIGTTYVRPYMIKLVMAVVMLTVLLSRLLEIPVYLSQLELIAQLGQTTVAVLKGLSFATLIAALLFGAGIILWSIFKGRREYMTEQKESLKTSGMVEVND